MISQKQLSLADIFEDCKDIFESDKPHFLTLLEITLTLMKLFRFIFTIIIMQPQVEIENIL